MMKGFSFCTAAIVGVAVFLPVSDAFMIGVGDRSPTSTTASQESSCHMMSVDDSYSNDNNDDDKNNNRNNMMMTMMESRSSFFTKIGGVIGSTLLIATQEPAWAAMSQEEIDKANIVKGYKRLQYLLDNWEKETTVCKTGQETNFGTKCERTPLKVMDYLGYKATDDPLFKADKTMKRLYSLVPASQDAEFIEAIEQFAENAEEASGMAYISSWGEANPGGGKDRVELFIERARKNVIVSKESLETVIRILDIKL